MYEIFSQEGQTLADIALQEYAHTDGMVLLFLDNAAVTSIDMDLVPGTALQVRDIGESGFNDALRQMLKQNAFRVNSGEVLVPGEGIGSMAIGTDNIIA